MTGNRKSRPLTAARVRTEKRPGRYFNGQGLYLQVDPSGARRWLQRIVIRGKRTDLGLGGDSLLATILVSLIESELSKTTSVVEIFRHPSIGEMARLLDSGMQGAESAPQIGDD